jgi:hypothetical protein
MGKIIVRCPHGEFQECEDCLTIKQTENAALRARVAVLEDELKVEHDVCMAAITVANDSETRIRELERKCDRRMDTITNLIGALTKASDILDTGNIEEAHVVIRGAICFPEKSNYSRTAKEG